jgi:uncharacterized membrane protein YeaQ/YmgE (transglycosylase-associated protein family)
MQGEVMNILMWILVGIIGGTIARLLMPGGRSGFIMAILRPNPGGFIVTILLGIAGAILGGFISIALGVGNGVDNFDIGTIFLSVVGAVILLVIYRLYTDRRRRFHL